MTLYLGLLVALLVGAISLAVYVIILDNQRRAVLERAGGRVDPRTGTVSIFTDERATVGGRFVEWLRGVLPSAWTEDEKTQSKLVQAGFDGSAAPAVYALVRLGVLIGLPMLALAIVPRTSFNMFVVALALAGVIGLLLPAAALDRLVQWRKERIQRALPDALDLLVVCVEAGVSLDAAILRVARDMSTTHPDLAGEFLVINRKVNAGITREAALHGLYHRTGVEEIRALVASMVQCERWGTSIARVLRVYAEGLRRKRRQHAEKKAAEAAVKMLFPMLLFELPALFIVIIGPAIIKISSMFQQIGQR